MNQQNDINLPLSGLLSLQCLFFFFLRDYVREELQYGYEGAVYLDSLAFNRFVSTMTSEL